MKSKKHASPALIKLEESGVAFEVLSYEHEDGQTHFGDETVEKLGLDPDTAFKTLIVQVVGEKNQFACAVVPVNKKLDLKAMASSLKVKKVEMAKPEQAEKITGYVVGGISPLGQKKELPTFMDDSCAGLELMVVSGGRRGLSVRLAPQDLARITGAKSAALAI